MSTRPCLPGVLAVVALVSACGGDGPQFNDDHPRIYLPRNRDRLARVVAADAPSWRRFKQIVDLQLDSGDIYAFQAWYAALVGQLTGEPRYCDYAVEFIDQQVRDDLALIDAGERPAVAFDSYLEVGERIGDLALTYDWCVEHTSGDQRGRWLDYANQAVWNVWHPDDAQWGGRSVPWSGWSIDNPSNNYYYSFLRATMMLGLATRAETADGDEWIRIFADDKIAGQLEPTFARDLIGGGSREGTGYGVAMARLFELYDFWHGSTGQQFADDNGHARASMLHLMHATVPTLDRLAPIGDHARDSTAAWFDYHRNYLQILTHLFRDDPLAPRATGFLAASSVPEMDQPFMYVYDFLYDTGLAPQPFADLGRAYFAPGVGQLYARSSWASDATWLSFIAGPYTESHAHQDQGSLMIYKGDWLAYDGVVDSTSGLTQEPEAHGLLRFTSGGQTVAMIEPTTSTMMSVARGPGWLHAAGDLTGAFDGDPAVSRWQRELVYLEPDCVVVYDRADSAAGTQQIWQLVSPVPFAVNGAAATVDNGGHRLAVERVLPAGAALTSVALSGDFTGGYRLEDTSGGGAVRHLHVLSIDGAVASAAASPSGQLDGVDLTLADGRTATVRFSRDAPGGTLSIRGGSGDVDATLAPGVTALPELE